jgi:glutaredoxin 3
MPDVVIYSRSRCGYCTRAKALLASKGVTFREIEIDGNDALRDEMVARAGGRRTVPQVFIGETHVGGCDDLFQLESEGRLDALLT